MKLQHNLLTALFGASLLAACGSDYEEPVVPPVVIVVPPVTAEVPVSASQTETGLFSYLDALGKATATAEFEILSPVDVSTFAPTLSENSEPTPLT